MVKYKDWTEKWVNKQPVPFRKPRDLQLKTALKNYKNVWVIKKSGVAQGFCTLLEYKSLFLYNVSFSYHVSS